MKIATRSSKLALKQVDIFKNQLKNLNINFEVKKQLTLLVLVLIILLIKGLSSRI